MTPGEMTLVELLEDAADTLSKLADAGPCEAVDLVRTADDAIAVECGRDGRRVYERDHRGHVRTRLACNIHAEDYDNAPN